MFTNQQERREEHLNMVNAQILDLASKLHGASIHSKYTVAYQYDEPSDMTWIRVSRFDIDRGGFVDEIDINFTLDNRRVTNLVIERLSDLVEKMEKSNEQVGKY